MMSHWEYQLQKQTKTGNYHLEFTRMTVGVVSVGPHSADPVFTHYGLAHVDCILKFNCSVTKLLMLQSRHNLTLTIQTWNNLNHLQQSNTVFPNKIQCYILSLNVKQFYIPPTRLNPLINLQILTLFTQLAMLSGLSLSIQLPTLSDLSLSRQLSTLSGLSLSMCAQLSSLSL